MLQDFRNSKLASNINCNTVTAPLNCTCNSKYTFHPHFAKPRGAVRELKHSAFHSDVRWFAQRAERKKNSFDVQNRHNYTQSRIHRWMFEGEQG